MVPKGADEDEHKQAARDVAGWADTMAQTLAEEQQGYNAVYNAERTVEDTLTELAETAESARAVVAALREAKEQGAQGVNLCLLLRASLDRARRALHSAINEVREARDNEAQVRRHTGITERVG
jgi:non-homologous end joining protein Ku